MSAVYASVKIGADGLPLISYHDDSNDDLNTAHCNGRCLHFGHADHLDSVGDVGLSTSLTIGADNLPLISYYDDGNRLLRWRTAQTPPVRPRR